MKHALPSKSKTCFRTNVPKVQNHFAHPSSWMKIDDLISRPRKGVGFRCFALVGRWLEMASGLIVAKICRQQWVGVQMTSARIWRRCRKRRVAAFLSWVSSVCRRLKTCARASTLAHPAESFLHQTNSYKCPRTATSNDSYFISAASWQMTMQLGQIRFLFINLDASLSTRKFHCLFLKTLSKFKTVYASYLYGTSSYKFRAEKSWFVI